MDYMASLSRDHAYQRVSTHQYRWPFTHLRHATTRQAKLVGFSRLKAMEAEDVWLGESDAELDVSWLEDSYGCLWEK